MLMNYTAPGERLIYTTIVFFTPSSRKLLSGLNHLHSHANQYRECTYFITLAPDLISHTGVAHCYDKYQAPPPGSQFRWHHRNHFSPWHCRDKFPLLISTNQIREKPAVIMTLSGVSFYSRDSTAPFFAHESCYFSHSNEPCAPSQHSMSDRERERREARELVKCTEWAAVITALVKALFYSVQRVSPVWLSLSLPLIFLSVW